MESTSSRTFLFTAVSCLLISTAAISAPINFQTGMSAQVPPITEKVWCRHGYCDEGAGVGGLIGGIVGGAIAAGAATAAQQDAQAAAQRQAAACAQRYRSYDPASGTYVSKGRRYPCP